MIAFGRRHARQLQPAHTAPHRRQRAGRRTSQAAAIHRIGTLDRPIQQRRIFDRTGHRPGRVEGRAQRQNAVGADPSDRRFETAQPAPGRRQPDRAAGIGADPPGRHAGRDRDPGPAARPAGGARQGRVPRVPRRAAMLVGAPAAHRELDRVRLAEDDHPGADETLGERRRVSRPPVLPHLRAAGRHPAFDLDQVLQRDRQAVQRPDFMARADRLVGGLGSQPRIVAVNLDKGVQLPILGLYARKQRGDDIDRRESPGGNLSREPVRRQQARIGRSGWHRIAAPQNRGPR